MARSLEVFVSKPADVDMGIFSLWLSGCDAEKAVVQGTSHQQGVSRLSVPSSQ